MVNFLIISLLPHYKLIYNFLDLEYFLLWDEVVVSILNTNDDTVFVCMLHAVSEDKKFDYEWEDPILGLLDKITFTKDMDLALVSSQPHDSLLLPLPQPHNGPSPLESKTPISVIAAVSLSLQQPYNALSLLKSKTPMLATDNGPSHLRKLIQFIKGTELLARHKTLEIHFASDQ